MDEDLAYRREPGSRLSVLLLGLLLGAAAATIALAAVAGNPFSDANEVVYETITVADIAEANDQICWSRNPERRDAEQVCAILALDPAVAPPVAGDRVTIGRVQLRTPQGDDTRQVVYVGRAPADEASELPATEASELPE
jgi:hypothetical protein